MFFQHQRRMATNNLATVTYITAAAAVVAFFVALVIDVLAF